MRVTPASESATVASPALDIAMDNGAPIDIAGLRKIGTETPLPRATGARVPSLTPSEGPPYRGAETEDTARPDARGLAGTAAWPTKGVALATEVRRCPVLAGEGKGAAHTRTASAMDGVMATTPAAPGRELGLPQEKPALTNMPAKVATFPSLEHVHAAAGAEGNVATRPARPSGQITACPAATPDTAAPG